MINMVSTRHFTCILAFAIHHNPARWVHCQPRFADGDMWAQRGHQASEQQHPDSSPASLTPKPSFSHTPHPLTMTESYPCPLPCDWQGNPSPSRTGSLKMNEFCILPPTCRGQSARMVALQVVQLPLAGAAGMDPPGLVSDKMKGVCIYKVPPPRAWLGLAGPHLKAPMTTPGSSLKGGAPGLQSGPRWAGRGR